MCLFLAVFLSFANSYVNNGTTVPVPISDLPCSDACESLTATQIFYITLDAPSCECLDVVSLQICSSCQVADNSTFATSLGILASVCLEVLYPNATTLPGETTVGIIIPPSGILPARRDTIPARCQPPPWPTSTTEVPSAMSSTSSGIATSSSAANAVFRTYLHLRFWGGVFMAGMIALVGVVVC